MNLESAFDEWSLFTWSWSCCCVFWSFSNIYQIQKLSKPASNNLGRPKFTYHVPSTLAKQVTAALENPHEGLMTL
jgi:hypothetical protein